MKTQESLQRTLCRAGVLLCAVAPVLWLMAATCYWKLPWISNAYAHQLAAVISDNCGVSATIGELKYLAPNRVEVKNLKVANPETFELILEVPSLIAERHASQWEVRMDSPQCALDQVLKLARMAHDRFLCRADDRLATVRIFADATKVTEGTNTLWTGAAFVLFNPSGGKSDLKVNFWADGQVKDPIEVLFVRDRAQPIHVSWMQLETKGIRIPVRVLKDVIPASQYLGRDATFEGNAVWLHDQQEKTTVEQSIIRNVQMDQLTRPLAYQMSGLGNIYLNTSTVIDGRIQDAIGIFDASQGSIPNEWLEKAKEILGLQVPAGLTLGPGPAHEYRNVELQFEVANGGVRIVGSKNIKRPYDDWPLVVLSDANGPLIYERTRDAENKPVALPISQLVSWLAASPYDQIGSNSVSQAAFQTPVEAGRTNTVGAYLMTVLPSPNVTR